MHTTLGFSRPVIDIEELEKKFEEEHKAAKDRLQLLKSKLSLTVLQKNDTANKNIHWRPEATPNLNHDLDKKDKLFKTKSEKESTMMGHGERYKNACQTKNFINFRLESYRLKGQYQYIGGSKFSNWGGVGILDSTSPKVNFGPTLPENYFLPSPFLQRKPQIREGFNQLSSGGPSIKSRISNVLAEKIKEIYYNKESKRYGRKVIDCYQ